MVKALVTQPSAPPVLKRCPCCWGTRFKQRPILWNELIDEWQLSESEAGAVNRQQGLMCVRCGMSMRAMLVAEAIMRGSRSRLRPFAVWTLLGRGRLLQVNEAAQLNRYLKRRRSTVLVSYPDVDMQALPFGDAEFKLVVHSDTLEHVPDPVLALRECRRVLKRGGALIYTAPVIPGRLTQRRDEKAPSYHGTVQSPEFLVITEYGADFWTQALEAGFREVTIICLDYPAGLAFICRM